MTATVGVPMSRLMGSLEEIARSPRDAGPILMIVRRPGPGQREVLESGFLDPISGLQGDYWPTSRSSRIPDGSPDPDAQVTMMNARVIELLARSRDRWPLAGDQFFVDLDLSMENLPAGTRIALGEAIVEVTPAPHTGCGQFVEWYGRDAMLFVNAPEHAHLRLRGLNARVIQGGSVRSGTSAVKIR